MKRKYKKYTPPAVLVLILVRVENSRKFVSTSFLFKQRGGFLSYRSPWCNDQGSRLKCAQRDQTALFHIKRLNPKLFLAILILAKHCQKTVETSQCFACIYYHWKKFLVQSVYVKWRALISLYIADTLVEPNRETPSLKPNLLKKNNLSIRIEKNYYFTLPSNAMQCQLGEQKAHDTMY